MFIAAATIVDFQFYPYLGITAITQKMQSFEEQSLHFLKRWKFAAQRGVRYRGTFSCYVECVLHCKKIALKSTTDITFTKCPTYFVPKSYCIICSKKN